MIYVGFQFGNVGKGHWYSLLVSLVLITATTPAQADIIPNLELNLIYKILMFSHSCSRGQNV